MIAFFPKVYDDELIYSLIARYHAKTGNVRYRFTVDDIYNHRTVKPSIEFVNSFTEDAMSWLTKEKPWIEMIEKHTMLPAYIRFLQRDRKQKALNAMIECSGNYNNVIYIPNSGQRHLRYCPCCCKEDREKYGETYWHRKHQINKVNVCPEHKCFLIESSVSMAGKSTPMLYDAESIIPKNDSFEICINDVEVSLARYIIDVFEMPLDTQNNQSVGAFLSSRLIDRYKKNGVVRRLKELYEDVFRLFEGVDTMTESQMQKVFNGALNDQFYVCQLAYFENIKVEELTNLPLEENSSDIDFLYQKLASKLNVDVDTVALIGEEVMKYSYEHNRVHKRTGKIAMDYLKMDNELYPKVVNAVDSILCSEGRPQKLSVAKIEKALKLPQKRIANLPKCNEYILSHKESQQEFWAREVCWAIYQIIDNEQPMNWKHIRNLTNMRPADLIKAIPFMTDEMAKDIAQQVKNQLIV